MDAVVESGKKPTSKHQIQPDLSVENESTNNAGRDGDARLARTNYQARTGPGGKKKFPAQLTTSRISNHSPVDLNSAECISGRKTETMGTSIPRAPVTQAEIRQRHGATDSPDNLLPLFGRRRRH